MATALDFQWKKMSKQKEKKKRLCISACTFLIISAFEYVGCYEQNHITFITTSVLRIPLDAAVLADLLRHNYS